MKHQKNVLNVIIMHIIIYLIKKNALYCINCKTDDMNETHAKRCIKCKTTIACYNYPNEIKPKYCYTCAKYISIDMIDIKNKKCIKCNNIQASFNYENEKQALYCENCASENMINIKSKKCIICNNKQASFNFLNETKPLYCSNCKFDDMINIREIYKHCKTELCTTIAKNPKYKGYCTRCFMFNYPNKPITRNYKIKENHVTNYIKEEFKDINLIFDQTILCGCSKRRPDIFIDLFNYCIIIEVDENQHKSKEYEENNRNYEIYEDLANRPLIFIRFNPDSYKNNTSKEVRLNKKVKSCFKICKTTGIQIIDNKKDFNVRLEKLKETINYHLKNVPIDIITIHKLYYDEIN
jgi:EsV-like protein